MAVVAIVLLLFPVYYMVAGSFMDLRGILRQPPMLWPRPATLRNYTRLLGGQPVLTWAANTGLVAAGIVVGSTAVSAMAGYAFATQSGLAWLYWLFLVSIMIPRSVLIIPMFVQMRQLHISGTLWAVIVPALFYPVGIFLYKNYVETIPRAMIDCARIDGASEVRLLRSVIAPLSKSALAAIGVMKFVEALTDYIWQFLVLLEDERQTWVVGLVGRILMQRGGGSEMNQNAIGLQLAAGTLMFLPLLAAFVTLQKHFREGVMNGGVRE